MPIEKFKPTYTFTEDRLAQLRQVVPEAFADGKINWNTLREALGDHLEEDGAEAEHFGLTWPGKRQARRLAAMPGKGALAYCPEEGIDAENTEHVFIEGDNLEVLKLMQKAYAGRVKLIYIDPPYNTGNDFVYKDDFSEPLEDYLRKTGQKGDGGELLTSNPKSSGRFHSNWLNMMYPRLRLARNLLRDDGCIFISIDDNEIENLLVTVKELFGQENVASTFIWEKRRSRENRKLFSVNHDYIVCATKDKSVFESVRGLLPLTDAARNRYSNPDSDPRGDWQSVAITAQAGHGTKSQFYSITTPGGRLIDPPSGNCWRFTKDRLAELIKDNRIWFGKDQNNVPRQKVFLSEQDEGLTPHTIWASEEVGTTDSAKRELNNLFDRLTVFETPKSIDLIRRAIEIGVGGGENYIVMDFFSGSGTTADALLRVNAAADSGHRYILVQLPEALDHENKDQKNAAIFCNKLGRPRNISEITKERIRRAAKKIQDENPNYTGDLGFKVFKLGPSQFKAWQDIKTDDLAQLQLAFDETENPLIENYNPETVFFEILLQEGFPLHSKRAALEKSAQRVWIVTEAEIGHRLFVCLEERLQPETIAALTAALGDNDILVCFDKALTDEAKARLMDRVRLRVL